MRWRGMSALRSIQSGSRSRSSIWRTSLSALSSSVCRGRVKPRIRHYPIGHEISQEKPLGETEFLPAAKKQLLGLLHFFLTLNFCFALCHVQGSPLGESRTVFNGVVLSTKQTQNARHNSLRSFVTFGPLTRPWAGHVQHDCHPAANARAALSGSRRTRGFAGFLAVCAARNDNLEMNASANPIALLDIH